ncbi:MAG: hypothetical protein L0241_24010 [Planctomycetia bacterium]|nr:hypothetical protein [Planctomycetia bacterium]
MELREPPASIAGSAWVDLNFNGVPDPGEPGAGGWVGLYQNGQQVAFVPVDTSGNYSFTGLAAGNYELRFVPDGDPLAPPVAAGLSFSTLPVRP